MRIIEPAAQKTGMTARSIIKLISRHQLFDGFDAGEIETLVSYSTIQFYDPGDILIRSGESNDTLYVLFEGALTVVLDEENTQVKIPIPPGVCLGEMSLIQNQPTSAMVMAEKRSGVLLISEDTFWNRLVTMPKGVRNLMSLLVHRIREHDKSLIKEVEERMKNWHFEKELETAGRIQLSIVPDGRTLFQERPDVDVFAQMNPARMVGGDFYDAMEIDDNHLYFAIGDATGKGMPAALFMMRAFTSLRLLISNNPRMEGVLPRINNILCRNNDDMMFVSLFAGVLNIRTGILHFASAGHHPPFVSMNGDDFNFLDVPPNPVLGIEENIRFDVMQLQLRPGDTLLLYTDGIPEATRSDHTRFDEDGILRALKMANTKSMSQLVQIIDDCVKNFTGGAPQYDDMTMLGLRYVGG